MSRTLSPDGTLAMDGHTFCCPHCGYEYESPILVRGVSHPCPKRSGKDRRVILDAADTAAR